MARESKADVVTRVDRRGPGIVYFTQVVAGSDSRLALGYQTPHLAAEKFPAIVKLGLSPRLAETERVAIGLGSGGGNTRREKVTRYVAGEFYIFQAPHNKERRPRLAGGTEELRQITLRSAGHGERIEGGRKISSQLARATHKFRGHKSAG